MHGVSPRVVLAGGNGAVRPVHAGVRDKHASQSISHPMYGMQKMAVFALADRAVPGL